MTAPAPTLLIEKLVPAPPQIVFDAWLDPEALRRFMCSPPGARVTRAEADPRVGGTFLIVMTFGDQDVPHRGEYLVIERHTRIAFTWLSKFAGEGSQVTLTFAEAADGQTKLTLEHVGLGDAENRARHHAGWHTILMQLAAMQAHG
jgi:uncharacterized protein YndB with AHSA1/START domain